MVFWIATFICILLLLVISAVTVALRKRNLHQWVGEFYFPKEQPEPIREDQSQHLFIAVCDHYEPEWGKPELATAIERVDHWCEQYPELFSEFTDSNGRVPQHTFFYPQDEYRPEYLDRLATLCEAGFGDVDVHLHHHDDTPDRFREKLSTFRETLHHRHGLLRRDPLTGELVYGFIHGNWSLCNSRPDGQWCGVNEEIPILKETGCYADFTMPSAPSDTQTNTINSIYYASDKPGEAKSHNRGVRARVGETPPEDSLLMIQGPLLLDWRDRKAGVMPRIENGDLHRGRPPAGRRIPLWLRANVHVAGQPNWRFIKLHTHGCKDGNRELLLGPQMQQFHRDLASFAAESNIQYHYVTAWEMALLVRQAEQGATTPELSHSHTASV